MATRGQKEIRTDYPETGSDSVERNQVNLEAEGLNGIKSIVSRKQRVGLTKSE
jgi:hypothetical protein